MDYIIRVIATKQIVGSVAVTAESKEVALAKVKQRINGKLRQEGYEFQIDSLEAVRQEQFGRRLNRSRDVARGGGARCRQVLAVQFG